MDRSLGSTTPVHLIPMSPKYHASDLADLGFRRTLGLEMVL